MSASITFLLFITLIINPLIAAPQRIRKSSYPYITGDTFRASCDHIIDETKMPFDPEQVKNGDTIFVQTDHLLHFFKQLHPKITNKYILITHNSARSVPGPFGHRLNDEKIIAWFGQNIDRNHPKLYALPLGIANSHWPRGNTKILESIRSKLPIPKDKYLYLNISVRTNPQKRKLVMEIFKNAPFCYNTAGRSLSEFYHDMATSQFILSPEGKGIDCHRTWQALYVGTIPLVKHSTIDSLFEGLPVILIDDWKEVTQEFLEKTYKEMSEKEYAMERLYADYWLGRIKELQEQHRDTTHA